MRLLFTLLLAILVGCSKPPPISNDTITAEQIYALMFEKALYSEKGQIVDREYALPTEKWITDVLYPELWKRNQKYGLSTHRSESNDCDDASGRARLLAAELNNKTSNSGVRAVAFGEYHYQTRTGGEHALNFAIIKENGKFKIIFFEPQTGSIAYLTEEEKLTVSGYKI